MMHKYKDVWFFLVTEELLHVIIKSHRSPDVSIPCKTKFYEYFVFPNVKAIIWLCYARLFETIVLKLLQLLIKRRESNTLFIFCIFNQPFETKHLSIENEGKREPIAMSDLFHDTRFMSG